MKIKARHVNTMYELTLCIMFTIAGGGFSKLCKTPVIKLVSARTAVNTSRYTNIPSDDSLISESLMIRTIKIMNITATIL
ncbi:MAG: hypothetical protein ACQERS_10980 [Bacteroidota bacterium]